MTAIYVYDDTAEVLDELAEKLDRYVADIIDELVTDHGEELE